MEMKTGLFTLGAFTAGALFLAAPAGARADAVSELKSFSVFDSVDLSQLVSEPKAMRGAAMSTSRFLSVQSAWVDMGTPAQRAGALKKWNPGGKSELKVILHNNGSNFSKLAQAPNNSAVQALVSATTSQSPELQISRAEAAKLPANGAGGTLSGAVANFWMGVLGERAKAFASGGAAAEAPYDHSAQAIRPGDELSGLLREQGKLRKQFAGLLDNSGITKGRGSLSPEPYWELVEVNGKGVLTLGASYSRQGEGGSYQAADVLYYASGGYYVALTLYQMWPVEVGGKPATLIWRGDMVSSSELAGLAGVERLGSESATMKDVLRSIRVFRRDTGGAR